MNSARQSRKPTAQPEELELFRALGEYVEKTAQINFRKGRYFSSCVRASFAKCYEFNLHAWDSMNSESAFFWLSSLRGICEDVIVLNYVQGIPPPERESLFYDLAIYELHDRLKKQEAFFARARPQQPILHGSMSPSKLDDLKNRIRRIWRAHGWPNLNRGVMPPTRQIAEKRKGDVLATLYDYLYRLTSGTVHFNVHGLLRTGWGDRPHCKFSTANFNSYYVMFGRIYGAFLFCSFFELLARFIRSDDGTKRIVHRIRQSILRTPRWPEMITFEEMNIEPPKIGVLQLVFSFMQSESEARLLKE